MDEQPIDYHLPHQPRRAVRRAVRLDCEVESRLWTGFLAFAATDLSPYGLWVETDFPLVAGEAVSVRLAPPRWPAWTQPIEVEARVARASLSRRRGERRRSGMGLAFQNLPPVNAGLLALALRGLPPPLPRRALPDVSCASLPATTVPTLPTLETDFAGLHFRAIGPFLTAGRIVAPPPAGRGVVIPFPRAPVRRIQGARARSWG